MHLPITVKDLIPVGDVPWRDNPSPASYSTIVDNRIFDKHWKKPTRFASVAAMIVRVIDRLLFTCNCQTFTKQTFKANTPTPYIHSQQHSVLDSRYQYLSALFHGPWYSNTAIEEYKCSRCGRTQLLETRV